jgi:MYXO-CTERM domain-containing protein
MHTGGGALATPGSTAGGLAILGLAGAGAYVVLRRKRAADGLS